MKINSIAVETAWSMPLLHSREANDWLELSVQTTMTNTLHDINHLNIDLLSETFNK